MRIKLMIEYDGTAYGGWQRQNNAPSIQAEIESAIEAVTAEKVVITGSGRTDAGVHAWGQVAHFDTESGLTPERFAFAINAHLPSDITIRESEAVNDDFHARYDAKGKWYRYSIYNHRQPSALHRTFHSHVPVELDVAAMQRALPAIIGRHDFAAFMSAGSDLTDTVRQITAARLHQDGYGIDIDVLGNGFLYNMVRIIAGTLIDIGRGKLDEHALSAMLQHKNRELGGATAKPNGLMLMQVFYEGIPDEKLLFGS